MVWSKRVLELCVRSHTYKPARFFRDASQAQISALLHPCANIRSVAPAIPQRLNFAWRTNFLFKTNFSTEKSPRPVPVYCIHITKHKSLDKRGRKDASVEYQSSKYRILWFLAPGKKWEKTLKFQYLFVPKVVSRLVPIRNLTCILKFQTQKQIARFGVSLKVIVERSIVTDRQTDRFRNLPAVLNIENLGPVRSGRLAVPLFFGNSENVLNGFWENFTKFFLSLYYW